MANLDGSGLSEVWVRAAQLVKRFTGAVNLTKGDLQTQVDTKITGTAISSSSAITTQGEYALDAREKNASIEGTLANQIDALNSNFDTKADKDQLSNPNLLDNAWFNVNSRGFIEKTSSTIAIGYVLDRWKDRSWETGFKYNESGLTITNLNTGNHSYIRQFFNNSISPGEYTVSVLLSDGTIHSCQFALVSGAILKPLDVDAFNIKLSEESVELIVYNLQSYTIRAVKLERGLVSTLHLDSAPNVEQERMRCMLSTSDTTDKYANKGALTQDLWNSTKTYAVGSYCIYNGSMWKCLVENSSVTPVEGDTWTATSISAELASIISKIDALSA